MAAKVFAVSVADWGLLGDQLSQVRHDVFVREQGVPSELEKDAADADTAQTIHAAAFCDRGEIIGTGRVKITGAGARIGRMAVLAAWRRTGVGAALLAQLCRAAADRGLTDVSLHAQTHAADFYRRHGFVARGSTFMEAGISHIEMTKVLVPG
jgi:predicted GNAT family N-acyltransferase